MRVKATRDLGRLVRGIRLTNHLRQTDLATEACVGRQWILALEQGKPSLEIGMVLRTLDALGLTLDIVAPERPPQWVRLRAADAEMIQARTINLRRKRRAARRAEARAAKLAAAEVAPQV